MILRSIRTKAVVGVATTAILITTFAAPASATEVQRKKSNSETTSIASGLNSPGGISYSEKGLFVTETTKGQVTQIDPKTGEKKAVVSGLNGPAAVTAVGHKLAVITGGAEVPDVSKSDGSASVYIATRGGEPKLLADLQKYELENNPDGQKQFDDTTKEPLDALSNPFAILPSYTKGYLFVADAGANAVLLIDRKGNVSNFFVPPLVTDGLCAGAENNDPEHVGCDPVPTGLAYDKHGLLYVSTASSLVPGQGRIYVLNPWNGKVIKVIKGLDAPTGVAVDDRGNVYASEVTFGAPEGEGPPPADFDPSSVGRIVKIDRWDNRTYAQVPMPLGLNIHGNELYAGTWAIAELFLQLQDKGEIVKVPRGAFK